MKKCNMCKCLKLYCLFSKNKVKKDGLQDACKNCKYELQLKYRNGNKEKASAMNHACYAKRKPQHLETMRVWKNKKYKEDTLFKLETNIRSRIKSGLKGILKESSTSEYLGCTFKEAKQHLECKFKTGMNWSTYGFRGWHVDHIIPIAKFDLREESQRKKAFHYTNLQPLWWRDNLVKGGR